MRTLHLASPLMKGEDVKAVQRKLGVTVDGEYGPVTAGAVRAWKHRFGYLAKFVNGNFTASDHAYLFRHRDQTRMMKLRAIHRARVAARNTPLMALRSAKSFIGLTESPPGSNVVPKLQSVLRSLGAKQDYIDMGFAWCAEFVHTCRALAGDKLAIKALQTGTPYPLYVPYVVDDARAGRNGYRFVSWADAKPGDMVTFDWEKDGISDHIGFVAAPPVGDTIDTVEGNTSFGPNGSQSNGGAVAARTRNRSDVSHIIRWA